jgi:hypothetical protein
MSLTSDDDRSVPLGDDDRREQVRALLMSGLVTEVTPRADSSDEFAAILARIQEVRGDLVATLVLGGFTPHAVEHGGVEQSCETCMYYLVHRRYCDLPELDMPVEPEWSCRLWRI